MRAAVVVPGVVLGATLAVFVACSSSNGAGPGDASTPDGGGGPVVLPDGGLAITLADGALVPLQPDGAPVSPNPDDAAAGDGASDAAGSGLVQVTSFGTNPAGLLMYEYVPAAMPPDAPLVVVLHGCTQGASDMVAMGWDGVADASKFYLVYPQQTAANNIELCFDWFGGSSTIGRGSPENESIKQMVDAMSAAYSVNPGRIFVVGFSAGAAEALLMLADWPDVFAGGAAIAGIPYDCGSSLTQAEQCMEPGIDQTAAAWGALVRAADSSFSGSYPPRVSLWHGSSDGTVAPENLTEETKQWTDVLGLPATATATATVAGFPHATYSGDGGTGAGNPVLETYSITGMNHDVPIDPTHGCGTAGTYFVDEKLCAAEAIAEFFGVAAAPDGG
jgi:poly(hydroxyalkanoate) depolymerase family esterase